MDFNFVHVLKKRRFLIGPSLLEGKASCFFDGVVQGGLGGCGVLFKINEEHHF